MAGFLDEVAGRFAGNEALVFDDPLSGGNTVRWTYQELRDQARQMAAALVAAGVEPGNRVAILLGNRPEAVAGLFGAAMAGAVPVMLSTFSTRLELEFLLADAEATVVLTQTELLSRRFLQDIDALRPGLPDLGTVVAVHDPSWTAFLAAGQAVDAAEIAPRIAATEWTDDGLIFYSSGTTDQPKGIVHSQRAPTLQFWAQAGIFGRHQSTRMWTSLPMFWTAGLNTAMGATLAAGGCWVMQETFEPGAALALMSRERVTEPYCLPHQTAALAEHPDWGGTDLSSLRCVYGKSAFARHPTVHGDTDWNMPVGYGLSETCAFFSAHACDAPRPLLRSSYGRLLPGNQVRIVEPDTGAALLPGQDGELLIKGPTLMKRYVGRTPDECFDQDGFFATGDVGSIDVDGYLHYAGRRTEMIKTGGANVSPAELEVQLRACAPVKAARVIGMPDERLGQVVVACVGLHHGATADAADITSFLADRVAAYKVPKRVLFFADGEIPMTASGAKVRDLELEALVAARLTPTPSPTTRGGP